LSSGISSVTVWLQVGDRAWDAGKIVRVAQNHEQARSVAYSVQTANGERDRIKLTMPASVGPFPTDALGPRGRQGSPGKVTLPYGWLDDPDDPCVPEGADLMHSGG
jgi:hypothetical protein